MIDGNSTVTLHYTGTLADGTVFDTSVGKEPLVIRMADHMVIPGFEKGLLGMAVGEKKNIVVSADDGYPFHEELIKEFPKEHLPASLEPKVGATLALRAPSGQMIPGVITAVGENSITVDLNFPLAGKELHFAVEIIAVG